MIKSDVFYRLGGGQKENKMWPNGYLFGGKEREGKNPTVLNYYKTKKSEIKKNWMQTSVAITHTTVTQNSEVKYLKSDLRKSSGSQESRT